MDSYELRRGFYKNLTLRLTASGGVRVSAPWFTPREWVDQFVADKADWIDRQRRRLPSPEPLVPRSWPVWGRDYSVQVVHPGTLPRVIEVPGTLQVRVPASWGKDRIRPLLERWDRDQVSQALDRLVPLWAGRMGLEPRSWTVKRLRSRWGSCRPDQARLVFNSRLAGYPAECLDYVVVHELAHLVEASHNARFHALVDRTLPGAKRIRSLLRLGSGNREEGSEDPA